MHRSPMTRRSTRPLLVGVALMAFVAPSLPATASPRNPTPQELRRADERVASAQRQVGSLQGRAEAAAEAYNGAVVRAQHARAASTAAAQRSDAARSVYDGALAAARAAQAVATAAGTRAAEARVAQARAEAQAAQAQRKLDRIAVGAFQNNGSIGMISQVLVAPDPLELANARNIMNHVGVYQDKVIAEAVAARARARAASAATAQAEQGARDAASTALGALERAATAKQSADVSRRVATSAAARAVSALNDAAAARRRALVLVAEAQAALGSARRTKAQLEAAARAAHADAAAYSNVDAPSDAARIAIHWAFEEIGVPYSWGGGDENGPTYGFAQGAGTKGFDCSGLTLFAYGKAGIHLDHYTGSQWGEGKRVSSRADLLPGDLMFFAYDTSDPNTIHHVSIYIGNGKMIEAPYTGEVVRVSSADRSDFIGGTRPWA